MTVALSILGLIVVCLTFYALNLNIKMFNAQCQLDRHQITINKFTSLQDEVTGLVSRMKRAEMSSLTEMAGLRREMEDFLALVRDAMGELAVDISIPANYDDIPDYDYRNDPGGQTIEGMLTHDRRNRGTDGNGTGDTF